LASAANDGSWPTAAVPPVRVSTTAIEGTADQMCFKRWLIAGPNRGPQRDRDRDAIQDDERDQEFRCANMRTSPPTCGRKVLNSNHHIAKSSAPG
jgi:hypothetical protein